MAGRKGFVVLLLGMSLLLQQTCAVWADGDALLTETPERVEAAGNSADGSGLTLETAQSGGFSDGGLDTGRWFEQDADRGEDEGAQLLASDANVRELEARLCKAWENRDTSAVAVKDLNIKEDELHDLYAAIRNRHPEYFYLMGRYSYYRSGSYIASILCSYSNEYTAKEEALFRHKIDYILSRIIRPGMSELEKILAVHDYLVLNAEYDYDNYKNGTIPDRSYTAYGILVEGTGVCQGYAMAAGALLNRLGIENYYASSKEMNHGWNLVKLNGSWYHLDATWDDPVPDTAVRLYHTYFLLSDETMQTGRGQYPHPHTGWTSGGIVCGDTEYERGYVFSGTSVSSYVRRDGGYWMTRLDRTNQIVRYGSDLKQPQVVAEGFKDVEKNFDGRNYYYIQGNKLIRLDTTTSRTEILLDPGAEILDQVYYEPDEKAVRYTLNSDWESFQNQIDASPYLEEYAFSFGEITETQDGLVLGICRIGDAGTAEASAIYAAGYNEKGRLISLKTITPQWNEEIPGEQWALLQTDDLAVAEAAEVQLLSVDGAARPQAAAVRYRP